MATPLPPSSVPVRDPRARWHAWRAQLAAESLPQWRERAQAQRQQWSARDLAWATRMHRAAGYRAAALPLAVVSRLGDGGVWYATMPALALFGGVEGQLCAARMALVGLLCVTLYLWLKRVIARPRPYMSCGDIRACVRALDQFSFPSGHVLHGVAFSTMLAVSFPLLLWVLVPFVILLAVSRVTLGLHYPSDVLAGGAIGAVLAAVVLSVL